MNEHSGISILEPSARVATPNTKVASPVRVAEQVKRETLLERLRRVGPTILVFVLLGGVAYVGHHVGWTIPKFDELFGAKNSGEEDWCKDHSVPKSTCVECDESLLPRLESTWCDTHGVHNCPFEREDVVQAKSPSPVTKEDLERAERALKVKERQGNEKRCKLHNRRIQFASKEAYDKLKLGIHVVWMDEAEKKKLNVVETISTSGEIGYEQPSVATISAPLSGRVWHITKKGSPGIQVKQGEVLALIDSADVGKAKAELLQAHAQMQSRKIALDSIKSLQKGVIAESRILEVELSFNEARIRCLGAQQALINLGLPIALDERKPVTTEELSSIIQFFGIPPEITAPLNPKTTTANLIAVIAPRDGIVTSVRVTNKEMVEAGKPIFVVADTSRMWLVLNVRIEDVKYLRIRDVAKEEPGQMVRFRADGSSQDVTGELVWKSTEVDEKTRTVQYRAEVRNPDGKLLANSYGKGEIVIREERGAILVPNEAVHWEGCCHIVFVRDKNFFDGTRVFHVRSVRPGVTMGKNTEIIAGLRPGEVVATENSANLRAELLKNKLGDGCGCGH